jgi:phosphoglycolate phosphatase-like HAD superfamily hydrolase
MPQKIDFDRYKTVIFDCDGVLLNSNQIKAQAFFDVAKVYGISPAEKLRDYHINNAGVSRIQKFEYLFEEILKKSIDKKELRSLLDQFSVNVKRELLTCELDQSLESLRRVTSNIPWAIVSGGDQSELREVFAQRGIDSFFDRGIFGNPASKHEIIKKENLSTKKDCDLLFFGDSKYDFEVSREFQMDFIFVSQWTNLPNWQKYIKDYGIDYINCLGDLLIDEDFP